MALQLPSGPINYGIDVPDPSQSFLQAFKTGTAITETRMLQEKAQREAEQQQRITQAFERLRQPGAKAKAKNYADLAMMLPETQAKAVRESFSMINADQQQKALTQAGQVFSAFKSGKPEIAVGLIERQIEAKRNSGDEAGAKFLETWRDVAKENPKAAEDYFGFTISQIPGGDKVIEGAVKLDEDRRKQELFPILKKQKESELRKATSEADVAEIEAKYADRLQQAQLAKAKRDVEAQSGQRVQSSSIRPDGTVVIVTSAGQTRVIGPDGVELTGQARVDAVRGAEEFGADIQALRSGARKAGEIGQTEAQKAFENVGKIRKNISNLESAIAALDAGANTGVIASKFPNWKASTIELQNIQRQLGLDIIGSVTFGALSEGELSLALETALPLNMNEAELKDWLIRKKTAQTKLADYITDQARFLSVPGRTLGDWLLRAEQPGGPQTGGMTAPGTGAVSAAPASEVSPPPQSSPTTSKSTIAPLIPPINMSESDRELWEAGYYTEDDKRVLIDFYATQPGAQ